jgi:hypothetical protein
MKLSFEFASFNFSIRLLVGVVFLLITACNTSKNPHLLYLTDFGAKSEEGFNNTSALQTAIDQATKIGGGKVVVTPGVYTIGTVFLKNNVTLEIMAGATLLGSPDTLHYTKMVWGHNIDRQPYHLIVVKDAENVTIEGGGVIDGNGEKFWQERDTTQDPQWILAKPTKISPMLEIQNGKNIRVKDVELKTGGGWTMHIYNSNQVQVQGVKIINNVFAPNGDGIDITGSSDVTISDCIIKTCDDAICLKTSWDSNECKRVAVTNNIIECSCAALKIGNESFFDIKQVTFSNNIIFNSSRAVGIYAESAGVIEDVTITNTVCDTRAPLLYNRPIHISLFKNEKPNGASGSTKAATTNEMPDDGGRQPALRNIIITNFIAKTEGRILITAEQGRMIENLVLRDVQLTYPMIEDPLPNIERAKSGQFSPRNPDAKKANAAIVAENVKNFVVENLMLNFPQATDTVPAEWRYPKRIANGTLDGFTPDYSKAKQTEFHAVWGRNLQGGYLRIPLAVASDKSLEILNIKNSTIKTY